MLTQGRYYSHSGKFEPAGLITLVGVSLAGVAVLSWVYGYAMAWIPLVYLNVLLVMGYGFALGAAIGYGARLGKVRNPALVASFAFLFALVAEYAGWVTWLHGMSSGEVFIWQPAVLWEAINYLAGEGVWSVSSWTPTGWALGVFWIVEALMVLGITVATAWGTVAVPFCETCQRWLDDKEACAPFQPLADPAGFARSLEQEDYQVFDSLDTQAESNGDTISYTQLELTACPGCDGVHLMTVASVSITTNDKGESTEKRSEILSHLRVPPEVQQRVRDLLVPSTPQELPPDPS